ncbi:MAG: amidase [Chromatiaceae bacterium]|jgi:Asp-tRNA(Asn)/Glu-tRNA(Gln) amidotransferase A subunit family amidase
MNRPYAGLPDATALLAAMAAGRSAARALMEGHLGRLQRLNPHLNAAIEVFGSQALAEAAAPRPGPLSGLPVSVKETFALQGETITAGSLRMQPLHSSRDAAAVARLKAAGAIVLARGNVPEFAMAAETDNLRYGRSNNPLAEDRTCGGSSGGDAALVASGCVAAGLGSDILGSIRIPASFCGIVGFRPASAAVDKRGSWPDLDGLFTDSWLAAGPLTRSVRDARLLYRVLSDNPVTSPRSVDGCRLILPVDFPLGYRDMAIPPALAAAERGLLDAGMRPERIAIGDVPRWHKATVRYLAWELMPVLERGLAGAGGEPFSIWRASLARLRGHALVHDTVYRLLLLGRLLRYRHAASADAAVALLEAARESVRHQLGQDGVILLPTLGLLAPRHGVMNRLSLRPGANPLLTPVMLCNYLDLPAITVPAWRYRDDRSGLAPGIMLAASPGAEALLFDTAERLEEAVGHAAAGLHGGEP